LLLVAFRLVNAPNCHLSLVLASVVQGDAVNCNTHLTRKEVQLVHMSECATLPQAQVKSFAILRAHLQQHVHKPYYLKKQKNYSTQMSSLGLPLKCS